MCTDAARLNGCGIPPALTKRLVEPATQLLQTSAVAWPRQRFIEISSLSFASAPDEPSAICKLQGWPHNALNGGNFVIQPAATTLADMASVDASLHYDLRLCRHAVCSYHVDAHVNCQDVTRSGLCSEAASWLRHYVASWRAACGASVILRSQCHATPAGVHSCAPMTV